MDPPAAQAKNPSGEPVLQVGLAAGPRWASTLGAAGVILTVMALKVGDTITVAESDYCYGLGELRLRLTTIGHVQQHADGQWINLDGLVLRADGSVCEPVPRHALVRVRGIRKERDR